jgi:hypothetical protein
MNLTPELLNDLAARPFATANPQTIRPRYKGERYMFEDVVQYLFTDDGTGEGAMIPSQFARLQRSVLRNSDDSGDWGGLFADAGTIAAAAVHAGRKETLAKHTEVWSAMTRRLALPLYDRRRTHTRTELQALCADPVNKHRYALICMLMPSLDRAAMIVGETAMAQQSMVAVLGLLRYRADHGQFPAVLDHLVPTYLEQLPIDVFDGDPLKYSVDGDGAMMLYSVGRNLRDDGGSSEQVPEAEAFGADRKSPADIVYWPPRAD